LKTIIITGANGHLGTIVANHFVRTGYRVIAAVRASASGVGSMEHPLLEQWVVDLTDEDEAGRFVAEVQQRHGDIHAVLLLVGGFCTGNIEATSGADLRRQFALNFESAYYVARPLFSHFLKKGSGRIVFIGARSALQPEQGKNLLAYSLSKSLLFRLAECLNEEARGTNVTASVVVPSTIDSAANRTAMPKADHGAWVNAEDLAGVLEFIVSGRGSALRETVLKVYNKA